MKLRWIAWLALVVLFIALVAGAACVYISATLNTGRGIREVEFDPFGTWSRSYSHRIGDGPNGHGSETWIETFGPFRVTREHKY